MAAAAMVAVLLLLMAAASVWVGMNALLRPGASSNPQKNTGIHTFLALLFPPLSYGSLLFSARTEQLVRPFSHR